ncbi:chorismate--pyruvate lyase family protein [Scytonema sp. NUACC26]|uniref:chorismate--pyruvate lyase family protein n=1 Tax=Scytonema sp. NUACC26 TaxID=3140176 RepID=UPI0034DBE13C
MQTKEVNAMETSFLRPDLQESLAQSHIDPSKLSKFQRVILTTDGTLTEILEAYLLEKIQIVKLSEEVVAIAQDIEPLDITAGCETISRKILLQGKISRRNWIYAESIIVPERLDEFFRERLLKTQEPIGRLWLEHKVETFKEIIDSGREPSGDLSHYFKIKREDKLFSRTYRVFSNRKPIMMITEKFPEQFFVDV